METIDMETISRFVANVAGTGEPLSGLSDSDTELISLHIDYCVALHQLIPGDAHSKRLWRQLRSDYAVYFEAWAVKHDLDYHFTE